MRNAQTECHSQSEWVQFLYQITIYRSYFLSENSMDRERASELQSQCISKPMYFVGKKEKEEE